MILPVNLFIGTILAMTANIILGSIESVLNREFDKEKLWKGIVKALMVIGALALLVVVGYLNPDIRIIDQMTIPEAMNMFTTAALIWYAAQGLLKIKEIVLPPTKVTVNKDTVVTTNTITETEDKITEVDEVEETNIENSDRV